MSTQVIVYVLTGLAMVVVVLTRLRMRRGQGAGRAHVGPALLNFHTISGVLAIATWLVFLLSPTDSALGDPLVGIVALGFWWVVTVCGLLMLMRWIPSSGKHASEEFTDNWSEGPGLSILAHVGMLTGVCVFTWSYLTSAV